MSWFLHKPTTKKKRHEKQPKTTSPMTKKRWEETKEAHKDNKSK